MSNIDHFTEAAGQRQEGGMEGWMDGVNWVGGGTGGIT